MQNILLFVKKNFFKLFKLSMIFDIKLIYYFSSFFPGYLFYLFCIFYGFFGCSGENCHVTHGLACGFALFMVGLVIQTYLLLKIPYTRNFLENLIGKSYLIKYLGEYTGSEAVVKITKYVAPALTTLLIDMVTATTEENRYMRAAKQVQINFDDDNKIMNHIPSATEFRDAMKQRDIYIGKAAEAKGIFSRNLNGFGFAASAVKK
jgi:hypothetical protein